MTEVFERLTVTRQQAARAEIDTAIELLFDGGSPVAIELLTWASVEMMRGLAEHRQLQTFQGSLEDRVKPEMLKEWREILKGHYNFFKHGDRDPERVSHDFMPEAVTYPLFGACVDYQTIYGRSTFAMMNYTAWFMARHPSYVAPEVAEAVSSIGSQLGHPEGRPFRASLDQVAENYRDGKRRPSLVSNMLKSQMGERFEP